MVLHWLEIVKFIKNNFIRFFIGTLLLTVTLFLIFNWNNETTSEVNRDFQTSNVNLQSGEEVFYTEEPPSNFLFYIEYEDGREFTNHLLIEQYLLSENMLNKISTAINIDLLDLIVKTENQIKVDYSDTGESKVIGVSRSERTSLIDLYVNVGDEKKSLKVAEYLHGLIMGGTIPFLENKNIFEVKGPSVKLVDSLDDTFLSEGELPNERSIPKFILFLVIISSFINLMILLFKEFKSKKIKYSFTYLVNETDNFMLIDDKLNNQTDFDNLVTVSETANVIIIRENADKLDLDNSGRGISYLSSNLLIERTKPIDRLIYIIEEDKTTRKWYKNQRNLNILIDIPTFVIQINKKKK